MTQPTPSPIEPCTNCKEQVRIPTVAIRRNFERRGKRCIRCAASPDELELLEATNWKAVPLAIKLAVAAEVAR